MGVRRFHRDRLAYFGELSSEAAFAGVTSLLLFDETQHTRSNVALLVGRMVVPIVVGIKPRGRPKPTDNYRM